MKRSRMTMSEMDFNTLQKAWSSVTLETVDDPRFYHWFDMMMRCYNPHHPRFEGVEVCEEWHNVENFYRDMGLMPSQKKAMKRN